METYPYPVTSRQTRPPEARWRRPIGIYWHSSFETLRQRQVELAAASSLGQRTGIFPLPRAHQPHSPHRQGPRLRAEPDPNRAQRCALIKNCTLAITPTPTLTHSPNPNPQPQPPTPTPTLTRHPDQELGHLHPGHRHQHRLLSARAARALPQLRLLWLGHLPEPPPQRGRRGWRGSIVKRYRLTVTYRYRYSRVCLSEVEGASAHSNALFLSARLRPPKILRRIVSNMY